MATAGLLIAAAITVPSNANAPLIRGPVDRKDETEVDGTRVIQVERHYHHIHRPIEAFVPWLLLGGGLGVLAALLAGDAFNAYRSRAEAATDGDSTAPGGPA
ncbi:MAG: hypothetical protein GXY03_13800 [Solirubrobacterales bacterium]|nr:hypothetical protein [Solirubrobacterales bacterium]